jgi:hypothetical protein
LEPALVVVDTLGRCGKLVLVCKSGRELFPELRFESVPVLDCRRVSGEFLPGVTFGDVALLALELGDLARFADSLNQFLREFR